MKWCRFEVGGRAAFGIVEGDEVVAVEGSPFETWAPTGRRHALARVTLLVPVIPQNFYAVGLNYRGHIEWAAQRHHLKVAVPAQPDVGYRSPNALVPAGADIVIPGDSPGPVEFEGELVAVVGRRAKHLAEDEALGCLLGYTLGNDVSERAWQQSDRTLWRAKNTDTFKPMGPVIETDLDPMTQRIRVRLNGRLVSEYDTGAMIFGVRQYIARMTRYLTLHPGDVIWFGCDGPTEPALQAGDLVEVENDAIGVLRSRVVPAA
ncbi:MAG: fumarylacetoacetate hydrolase family protein [Candidatus Rokubacteria bacterium]|nr:fumarylacetoacetate hydrolase family protein [Candidatus Rokubacteria bacterium]